MVVGSAGVCRAGARGSAVVRRPQVGEAVMSASAVEGVQE